MSQKQDSYTIRSLILTAVISAIVTVVALEVSGKINHWDRADGVPIGDFKAIYIKPGETFRMSPKPSNLHAECDEGYLVIASDNDDEFQGILVDYKKRGVRCSPPEPAASPDTAESPEADGHE